MLDHEPTAHWRAAERAAAAVASATNVGRKSSVEVSARLMTPAGTMPGQRMGGSWVWDFGWNVKDL